jgi:hypothetical protein
MIKGRFIPSPLAILRPKPSIFARLIDIMWPMISPIGPNGAQLGA